MKKIFTLIAATLFSAAVFAADHKPVVTVKANKNYEIVIDGQSYFSSNSIMNLSDMRYGQHSIKVFEVSRGFIFRKGKHLVDASSFQLRGNDVAIYIDFRGQISITESKFDNDRWNDHADNGWGDTNGHDKKDSHHQDNHDKDHGNTKNDRDKRF